MCVPLPGFESFVRSPFFFLIPTRVSLSLRTGPLSKMMRKVLLAAALGTTALADVASYEGSPFEGVAQSVNPYYYDEIHELAIPQMNGSMAEKAKLVSEVPTFQWLYVQFCIFLDAESNFEVNFLY